jgi:hypothetical protein
MGEGFFCLDEVEPVLVCAGEEPISVVEAIRVDGPWPNPSNGRLFWRISLPEEAAVHLEVFDMAGRCMMRSPLGVLLRGAHEIDVEPAGLPSGAYMVRFVSDAGESDNMMIRMK